MTHQAGLQAWIPFYLKTLHKGQPDPAIYQHDPSEAFPLRVAEDLYIRKDYPGFGLPCHHRCPVADNAGLQVQRHGVLFIAQDH